ncbi:MAG: hypothetical protein ABR499_01080 [Gemmatimonadaceae bacterium]
MERNRASDRDYTALRILAGLCAAEVAVLCALIVIESPLTPLVHRLLETPSGVIILVMSVVTLIMLGMIVVLLLRRRSGAGHDSPAA